MTTTETTTTDPPTSAAGIDDEGASWSRVSAFVADPVEPDADDPADPFHALDRVLLVLADAQHAAENTRLAAEALSSTLLPLTEIAPEGHDARVRAAVALSYLTDTMQFWLSQLTADATRIQSAIWGLEGGFTFEQLRAEANR